MIGTGHYVRLVLWNDSEVVHEGILSPGESTTQRFTDGPETITAFSLVRLTKAEVDALPEYATA